jgi:hypothetical protein
MASARGDDMAEVTANGTWVILGDPYLPWYYNQNEKDPETPMVYYGAGYYYGGNDDGWTLLEE